MLSPSLLLHPSSSSVLFFFFKLKTGKQHLDFTKYNRLIPACGFTLGPGMGRSSNRYFSKKSLGSPKFKLARAIWVISIFKI